MLYHSFLFLCIKLLQVAAAVLLDYKAWAFLAKLQAPPLWMQAPYQTQLHQVTCIYCFLQVSPTIK